jgi:hypothetical protein
VPTRDKRLDRAAPKADYIRQVKKKKTDRSMALVSHYRLKVTTRTLVNSSFTLDSFLFFYSLLIHSTIWYADDAVTKRQKNTSSKGNIAGGGVDDGSLF